MSTLRPHEVFGYYLLGLAGVAMLFLLWNRISEQKTKSGFYAGLTPSDDLWLAEVRNHERGEYAVSDARRDQ